MVVPLGRGAITLAGTLDRFLLVTLVLLGAARLLAAEPSPSPAAAAADQLKALNDQTIIQSSVWLDTEWNQFKHGAEENTWTLGGLWGWPVSNRQDGAVRLKVHWFMIGLTKHRVTPT